MKLAQEIKDAIVSEFKVFQAEMYAGKSDEERNKLAQFFTPPELSIPILEALPFSELAGHTICDPTCGSGNLLAAALIAGADYDKIYGNEFDAVMVDKCLKRLLKINPNINSYQIHQGNALIPDCITIFGPEYDRILQKLLKGRKVNKHIIKEYLLYHPDEYETQKQNQKKYNRTIEDQETRDNNEDKFYNMTAEIDLSAMIK